MNGIASFALLTFALASGPAFADAARLKVDQHRGVGGA